MKNQLKIVTLILFISLPLSAEVKLTNSNATMETKALYRNLSLLEQDVLFGHQDSLAYGTRWWGSRKKDLNSDIKAVTGSFPAVFGLDVGGIGLGAKKNLDGVAFDDYQYYIKQIFLMGGVNTISWHMYSPIDRKNSWNKKSYVKQLVPGGKYHERLIMYLNAFINRARS
jgi:mannan endo-1,4-beta-mannosidase